MKIIIILSALCVYTLSSLTPTVAQEPDAVSIIGFDSIEEAFNALEGDPDATPTEYEGWNIFTQKLSGSYVLWSFTPEFHPAHPAVIKRLIVSKDGELSISMNALCYAEKSQCDALVEQFKVVNENLKNRQ